MDTILYLQAHIKNDDFLLQLEVLLSPASGGFSSFFTTEPFRNERDRDRERERKFLYE